MGSDIRAGEMPAIPEDTVDLGERLDPIRTLLRRTAIGDQRAAGALVDVLGPRIHGLAVHVTGSPAKAGKLTVSVLRACLRDAGDLAASGLPGDAAVLDRARRAAVATRPSGDVRSLVAPDIVNDRTRDRREVDVMRALLTLPPQQRALVESAAQGRFAYTGRQRAAAAGVLAHVLDRLVPFGGPEAPETRALAALDALALADEDERGRLRDLTASPETAGIHRHAIEAAARLTLLTAVPPSRDLHLAVLEGFNPAPRPSSEPLQPDPEPVYHGTYATPVLGTDSQRRLVGPPAVAGGLHSGSAGSSTGSPMTPSADAAPPLAATHPAPAPAFAFRSSDEMGRSRRAKQREKRRKHQPGPAKRGIPWLSRTVAVLTLICAVVLAGFLIETRHELMTTREFAATWAELSVDPGAELVPGLSDNGSWQAVIAEGGIALRAEGVAGYEGEVLQLWSETDGVATDLGVLEISGDGAIRFSSPDLAERLIVTREMEPQNMSGTPSSRIVASLDPELIDG